MAPYPAEGTLVTDKREVAISETWDTQTEWEAYQSITDCVITNGTVLLEEQSAIPDGTVDNYELKSANTAGVYESGEGIPDYYSQSQNVSAFAIQTGTVLEGNRSVELSIPNTGSNGVYSIVSQPADGLNQYPSRGDTFEFLIQADTSDTYARAGVAFGCQNATSGYFAYIVPNSDEIRLNKDGQSTNLNTVSVTLSNNTLYRGEIAWETNDDITFSIYESGSQLQSITANDSTYSSESGVGIAGIGGFNAETAYLDGLAIV